MENWKTLENFPGYEGSTEGRIRNIWTQKVLTPVVDKNGSVKVTIRRNNVQRTVRVNRALAETFIGDCTGRDVRHRDGDPYNNSVDNLEICTRSELIRDAYARGTKQPYQSKRVRVIETDRVYDSIKECAYDIGCDKSQISACLKGKCSHVKGYHFELEDSQP